MRILFDQGAPLPLREWLAAHHVETARQRGWSELLNGDLLAAAEAAGFDLFITTDQNLRLIAAAVDMIGPRQYVEWSPP